MRLNAGLTQRESQIAELLAWGGARKEVADRLNITVKTVEVTTQNLYRKIGIQKATELSVWWFVTRMNVPISMDPWKKTLVSCMFLLIIMPYELGLTSMDAARTRTNTTRVETVRTTRTRKD